MNQSPTLPTALNVPVPAQSPSRPFEALLAASPDAFGAVYEHMRERRDPEVIRQAITHAEGFVAEASRMAGTLRQAVEPADAEEIAEHLGAFVMAWPNASGADLAGYGAQLADDVIERRPCRYALREGLRHLRQTSRFLPSIAEVLTALDEAQSRLRNTVWHLNQIPAEIEKARADLAAAERWAVSRHRTGTAPGPDGPTRDQEPAP